MPSKYTRRPLLERFWAKVDPCRTDGCYIWLGAKTGGYGFLSTEGKNIYAHHVLTGPVSKGFEWDHLCRITFCVAPDHLELVTSRINALRSMSPPAKNAAKTHCPRGHPYDLFNTYTDPDGRRRCRQCQRERHSRS